MTAFRPPWDRVRFKTAFLWPARLDAVMYDGAVESDGKS